MALITLFNGSAKAKVSGTTIGGTPAVIRMLDAIPAPLSCYVFVYNFTTSSITVQPIAAPVQTNLNEGTVNPFVPVGSSTTIDASSGAAISIPVLPFVSVQITVSSSTSGTIEGFYNVLYNYTTH